MTAPASPEAPAPNRRRAIATTLVMAAAVAVLTYAVWRQRDAFVTGLERLGWTGLVGATVSAFVALSASGMAWRYALRMVAPEHPLPLGPAASVFFISQAGKYIPGSVWPVVLQMEMTRKYGIARAASGAGMLVTMLISTVTSGWVAIAALAGSNLDALRTYWYTFPLLVVGLVALTPPVLTALLRLAGRVLRRPVITAPLTWRALTPIVLWSFAAWPAFGLHAWIIASDLTDADVPFATATGAFALAWVVGFLVFFSPAGVGAREGVLVVAFSGVLSTGEALTFAVVSRVILTVVDVGAAGVALAARAWARTRRGATDPVGPPAV